MRALFLVGRDARHPEAGGGDIQAWSWARWLVGRGYEVEYVCQSSAGLPREEEIDGVKVLRLGSGVGLAIRAWSRYRRDVGAVDLVLEDPIGSGRTPYLSPLYARCPVVVAWWQVSAVLLKELHGRCVAEALSRIERVLALCYRGCRVFVPSRETATEVVTALRLAKEKVDVIHATLPSGNVRVTPEGAKSFQIVCVGVFRPYKMFEHVITALAAVVAAVPEARLTVVGRRSDAKYLRYLRELSQRAGVDERVRFALDVTEYEKSRLIGRSAVLVIPSKLEGYGIVSIEANVLGVPVIASSGVPEAAVCDGRNGLRYRFGDIEALTVAMVALLSDDVLHRQLSEGGIAWAAKRTVDVVGIEFEAMLRRAVKEGLSGKARNVATAGSVCGEKRRS